MKRTGYIAVPAWIVSDPRMYPSTKQVLVALLAYSGRHNTCRKSIAELAILSGRSRATVRQALQQMQSMNVIKVTKKYRYSDRLSRPVNDKNIYHIRRRRMEGAYVLLPRELLGAGLTPCAFVYAMHVYLLSGRKGRAYPSLRRAARKLDITKATVCRALRQFLTTQVISVLHCRKANNAFSCNSYYPTSRVSGTENLFSMAGGLIFEPHSGTKKITRDSSRRESKYGVAQFGSLHSFSGFLTVDRPFFFDGTGVIVSAAEEQELVG